MNATLTDAITIAWYSAILWLSMMVLGYVIHLSHRHDSATDRKKVIIQITTIGDDIVPTTISDMRKALSGLDKSVYEVWVVTEPSDHRTYPLADKVMVVPPAFDTPLHTKFKSRALEFARLYRMENGYAGYKMLYIDDDSIVDREFFNEVYNGAFDLMQGTVTIVRRRDILSYLDGSVRAISCLSLCSFFQAISKHLWTHGEGFAIDERVDKALSWDHPGFYAEDMVYGALATRKMGFKMKSSYATIKTNAPVSVWELIKQRRRWFWVASESYYLVPLTYRLEIVSFSIMGLIITPLALAGIVLSVFGAFHPPGVLAILSEFMLAVWIGAWAISGYYAQRDILGVVAYGLSSLVAPLFNFFTSVIGIILGPVDRFETAKRIDAE